MKKWIHATTDSGEVTKIQANGETKKLKRTPESGHSYEGDLIFDTPEEYLKWCEEDKLYED